MVNCKIRWILRDNKIYNKWSNKKQWIESDVEEVYYKSFLVWMNFITVRKKSLLTDYWLIKNFIDNIPRLHNKIVRTQKFRKDFQSPMAWFYLVCKIFNPLVPKILNQMCKATSSLLNESADDHLHKEIVHCLVMNYNTNWEVQYPSHTEIEDSSFKDFGQPSMQLKTTKWRYQFA